ncbi:MAG: ribonuclease Z [Desulfobacterales bacterium]|nr:ribonuclease Z [Desulfobacterales bacterium]
MPPLVFPSLVNETSGDPGLFVPFAYDRLAYLFDLGNISALSSRNLLKVSHVFVSHTHMDHFIGFDTLLRIILGRDKTLYLFGPEGFLANVEGKLAGYSWNLVNNYSNPLILEVAELTGVYLTRRRLSCQHQFQPISEDVRRVTDAPAVLCEDAMHSVTAAILDHGLPCLGFALEENFRINIRKDMLNRLDLATGPWLHELKQAIYNRENPDSVISAPTAGRKTGEKTFRLADLADQLAIISKGQKISYIADVAYNRGNIEKIRRLAKDSDHLFIESPFLESDRSHARRKKHLTARQAGEIAGLVGARRFTLFHFSPRYDMPASAFYAEANKAYEAAIKT